MKKLLLFSIILSLFSAASEDELVQQLNEKLKIYVQSHPFVGVRLIFSQNKYAPGDTAYFSAHVFNEDFAAIKGKKIFGLSLADDQGKSTLQIKFSTNEGKAFNQIIIPSETKPGLYRCVVYAEASGRLLHQKELMIVEKNKIKIDTDTLKSKVAFFPEGETLVCGLKNKIVIKSCFKGVHVIKDNLNEEVARVTIDRSGISHFFLTPVCGKTYYAEIENQSAKYLLSNQLSQDGIVLSVNPFMQEYVSVDLRTPINSPLRKQQLYLVVLNRQKIAFSKLVDLTDSASAKVSIPKESLRDGLSQISVINKSAQVLLDRVFFFNRLMTKADLKSTSHNYKQRETVTQELSVTDKYGNPLLGNFSVSVFKKSFFSEDTFSFSDAFYLDFLSGGRCVSSKGLTTNQWYTSLDDYLISENHKLISWNEVMNSSTNTSAPNLESNLKLKGKAIFKNDTKVIPDSTLIVTYLQNAMVGYETSAFKGNFDLTFLYDFFGEDDLFYYMENHGKDLVDDSLVVAGHPVPQLRNEKQKLIVEDSIDYYADHQFKKRLIDRSYGFFISEDKEKIKYVDPNAKFEEETLEADVKVNVHDYVVFHTMEDLVREVVPYLMVRRSKKETTVRLLLTYRDHNVKPKAEPLFIIDGILSKDKDYFLSLKPTDILTLKMINNPEKLAQWGTLGKNGIVLVSTKNSLSASKVKRQTVKIQGLNKALDFPAHNYADENKWKRIPDFRALLYWNPSIKLDQNGKANFNFYTSDLTGEYVIQIRGVTSNGLPFESESSFTVERK